MTVPTDGVKVGAVVQLPAGAAHVQPVRSNRISVITFSSYMLIKGVVKIIRVDEIPDILNWSALQTGCSDVLSLQLQQS